MEDLNSEFVPLTKQPLRLTVTCNCAKWVFGFWSKELELLWAGSPVYGEAPEGHIHLEENLSQPVPHRTDVAYIKALGCAMWKIRCVQLP